MLVKSQIKFWVFGLVGALGVYLVLSSWFGERIGIGLTLVAACVGAMILGVTWNIEKEGEKAATYKRMERDERAKQSWLDVAAQNAKQIEQHKEPRPTPEEMVPGGPVR